MTVRRCRAGVTVYNGQIWAIGGFNGNLRVRTVDIYDPAKSEWSLGPQMEARRSTLGAGISEIPKNYENSKKYPLILTKSIQPY